MLCYVTRTATLLAPFLVLSHAHSYDIFLVFCGMVTNGHRRRAIAYTLIPIRN